MTLKEKILSDLKEAMKAGDTLKRDTLRFLDSAVRNVEIEKKKRETGLADSEIMEVIARSVKQRRDSIEQYEAGGRADLADKEKKELAILLSYLPAQLGENEAREIIKEIIARSGVSSKSETGKIMGLVMGRLRGQIDGNLAKKIVKDELR